MAWMTGIINLDNQGCLGFMTNINEDDKPRVTVITRMTEMTKVATMTRITGTAMVTLVTRMTL